MIHCQKINGKIKHQVVLIEQSDLCTAITNIYDQVYQGLIFYALTDIQSADRMGERPD